MKKSTINFALIFFAVVVMAASIWGPEMLTGYRDRTVLDRISTEISEGEGQGYRYRLGRSEKLFILSQCLNSQSLPQSEQSALTRTEGEETDYQDLEGTYAFVVNHRGPTGREITREEIFHTCNEMLSSLKEFGILPETVKEVNSNDYEAVLYSAIDVLEPRNNVAVWKVSLSNSKKNADKANRLLDAYVDADDGKIYEWYARTEYTWEDIDTDAVIEKWSEYMGLESPEPYETDNPLLESATYYKKYMFSGVGEEKCIVTIGFYEGINELFLKVSR
ncbi:hypothetical protein D7V94_02180 [Parablautia intestinalis]|uniref:Uncharacterized protein n=1 Tax=Parablautia intestinalis TaxID=2320100 RepID=A0A3A9AQ65_9FIRM|nr:hypothetical protein [Parablautia intestinalis]RKI93532.1 hypothetical protein D7V94_02180 [Parablautia intestinalis]